MPAKNESQIIINIAATKIYHFEMDVDNMRIMINSYDVAATSGERVNGTNRSTGWIEMLSVDSIPNLPESDIAVFSKTIPLVKQMLYAFAAAGGIIPNNAIIE
jgi:hypothetical protein